MTANQTSRVPTPERHHESSQCVGQVDLLEMVGGG